MLKRGLKKHLFSGVFTVIVITLLLFATPARAVNVTLNTPDINAEQDLTKVFEIEIEVNDEQFLPLLYTEVDFDNGEGVIKTCTIDNVDFVSGCDFLSVLSKDFNVLPGFGYGYGTPGFGYGYGYGYGDGVGFDTGTIRYQLEIDVTKLPENFLNRAVGVETRVFGGDSIFTGGGLFNVFGFTNGVAVNNSLAKLLFTNIKGENTAENQIKTNLNLIQIAEDNVMISWSSSNTNVINPFSGKVTRPVYTDTDKVVTLTATLFRGLETATKSFTLTVLKEAKSDEASVDDALADLDISDLLGNNTISTNILTDLTLPTAGLDGTKISWSPSNPGIIEADGSVIRPNFDTPVTLTANVKKGAISKTKTFSFVVKGTVDLNELAVNSAKLALTEALLLNGNPAKDKVLGNIVLVSGLTGHPGVAIGWVSSNINITALNGSVFRDTVGDKQVTLTATLSKSGKSTTKNFILTVKKKIPPAVVVAQKVEVNVGVEEVVIDNTNIENFTEVEIPAAADEKEAVTLNVKSLVNEVTKELQLAPNKTLTLTRKSSGGGNDIKVEIPAGTNIKGEANWNGLIIAPTVKEKTTTNVTTGTTSKVIEVGLKSGKLILSKATKLTIPGEAGKNAGFVRDGVFTSIQECTAGQIADPNTLPAEGDCFTASGADLIIWTKHFTEFVSFVPNPEVCDGIDNDGDTLTDEGVTTTFYRDVDGDGYGNANFPTQACGVPANYASNNQDCNDGSNSVKPGAAEACNGVDDNCNSQTDEGGVCAVAGVEICNNVDDDADGQTDEGLTRSITCGTGICGASASQTCNAGNWVGACTAGSSSNEIADGLDNNCNGQTDEGFLKTFYLDVDGDDYGQADASLQSAFPRDQYSALSAGDCRPGDKASYPGATELCDGNDNNCNGQPDEVENIKTQCYDVANKKYAGIGACSYGYYVCLGDKFSDSCIGDVEPVGLTNAEGPSEVSCNGIDEDCDGLTDENWDQDGDGYTTCGTTTDGRDKVVDTRIDCRDDINTINPGVQEICNGIDDDCSGEEDDNLVYELADNQNGVCNGVVKVCTGATGWVEPNYDSVEYYELSELTCDGRDNNCNGLTDEGFPNLDGDRLANCVDPDIDNDGIVDNRDAIIGTPRDSNSTVAYKLFIGGDEFTGRATQEIDGRRQITIREDGRVIAWLSYIFDPTNLLDFRDVILGSISNPVDETGRGSSLLISGINSPTDVRKSYLLTRFDDPSNNMVCVKMSQISSIDQMSTGCTMPDELLIPCNGRNVLGFRCSQTVRDGANAYRIDGVGYYAVSEVRIIPSDFSRDNRVDFDDFFAFADHFGTDSRSAGWNRVYDLTYDNKVDFDDFFAFADHFGRGSTQARLKMVSTETLLSLLSSPEICDGMDNNGDGNVDEDLTKLTGETDEGTCEYGLDRCVNGEWRAIVEPDTSCQESSSSSSSGSRSRSSLSSTSACEGSVSCSWSELNENSDGCGELRCSNTCGESWVEQTLSCQAATQESEPAPTAQPAKKPLACSLKGDFNDDRKVDYDDFFEFVDGFNAGNTDYDVNGDDKIDYDDFFEFADEDNFGKSC
ncbi:MAG: hypothetical protein HY361_01455 [Candidatus Aenigmarchaeota archaeon]|nr:hypothetical protein [Candidatus Aenigmarchaeota archaeon]